MSNSSQHGLAAFRPTTEELEVLQEWCDRHPGPNGERSTISDALRAATKALAKQEKRRAQNREYDAARTRPRVAKSQPPEQK